MLLSAKLSYVEGSVSIPACERERKEGDRVKLKAEIYSWSWQNTSSSAKTTRRSLSLSASCCITISDPVFTNPLSLVYGSSTWVQKEAKSPTIPHRLPPHPHPLSQPHTHTFITTWTAYLSLEQGLRSYELKC